MSASYDALDALYDRANLTGHFSQYIGYLNPLTAVGEHNGNHDVCHELWIGIRRRTRENKCADLLAIYHFGQVELFSRPGRAKEVVLPSTTSQVGHSDLEQTVFIEVVEFPEHLKKRGKSWVRAAVWLELFDFDAFIRSQIAKFALNEGTESSRGVTDRELQNPRGWGRIRIRAGLKNGSLATGRKERGLRGKEVEGN